MWGGRVQSWILQRAFAWWKITFGSNFYLPVLIQKCHNIFIIITFIWINSVLWILSDGYWINANGYWINNHLICLFGWFNVGKFGISLLSFHGKEIIMKSNIYWAIQLFNDASQQILSPSCIIFLCQHTSKKQIKIYCWKRFLAAKLVLISFMMIFWRSAKHGLICNGLE